MKATPNFIQTIAHGIKLIKEKYGEEVIQNLHPMRIYFIVHDAMTAGHEHNAKITMERGEWFHKESMNLTDDNIVAAVKKALK